MNRFPGLTPSASSGTGNPLPRRGRWTLVALLVSALFLACAADSRYRVLSFFFDGVPDPNRVEEPLAPVPLQVDFTKLTAAERAEYLAKRIEAPTVYFHEPVRNRECSSCHVAEERPDTAGGWMAGLPQLIVPIEQLCGRCHEPPEAPYVHGPVATGRCDICHVAHQSPYPHLLRFEKVEGTCRSCHQGQTFISEQAHDEYGEEGCTACHDPHSSENQQLLLDPDNSADSAGEGSVGEADADV